MNIEETKEAIKVMQAFVDGKIVQYKQPALDCWYDLVDINPIWNWGCVNYRIKPEPKEIWVNEYDGCWGIVHGTKEEAKNRADRDATRKAVRYREVME